MNWKDHIEDLKAVWVGKSVTWRGVSYHVVDVDYNGVLMIDKPSEYNDTTALCQPHELKDGVFYNDTNLEKSEASVNDVINIDSTDEDRTKILSGCILRR